jgi:hypothetical protein
MRLDVNDLVEDGRVMNALPEIFEQSSSAAARVSRLTD